jgi:hypothetical protein
MMDYLKLVIITLFSLYTHSVFANTSNLQSSLSHLRQGQVVLEVGAYQGTQGTSQHVNIQDLLGDYFTISDRYNYNGLVGLGYFVKGGNYNLVNLSYGLNAFYLAPISVSGDVIQENLFANLSYRYSLANYPVYAMVKSAINIKSSNFALTLDAGIGPNFMHLYNFDEKSLDGGITIPEHPYTSVIRTTFTGTIGAGIRMNYAQGRYPVEIGYRFFYLGQGHFNTANNQILDSVKTNSVFANAIVISVGI